MQITKIEPLILEVTARGDWVFVLIHTDAGITGVGEASHGSNDALVVTMIEQYSAQLIGEDPRQISALWARIAKQQAGRVGNTAVSGIEQALWDILGQHLGVPIHALFGGAIHKRLRLYANINRHAMDRSPAGFATAAKQAVDEGFTAIKMAPFDELVSPHRIRTGPNAAARHGIARVEAVRAAIGDEIELAVDCHSRMDTAEAIAVGQALAGCNLFWFEEPVSDQFPDELAKVAAAVPMPVASAESIYRVEGFRPFLTERVVDVIMPDVKHNGGVMETKRIMGAARLNDILVAPHQPAGPVATAVTAQVCCTDANFYVLEHAWGEVDWRANLLQPAERIEDGYLVLSDEPGIGHRLNSEIVAAYRKSSASVVDSSKALRV